MEIIKRAPMLGVFAALVAGAAVYDRFGAWSILFVAAVYCGVMLCSYERELPGQWSVFAVGLMICLFCCVRMYYAFTLPPAQNITLTRSKGTVQSIRTYGKRMYAAVIAVDGGGRYVARLPFMEMMPGDRILFDGVTRSFRPRGEDSTFDEARFWRAKGVDAWVSLDEVEELPARFSLARMRYILSRKLIMYMPERVSAYLRAAWLGERDSRLNEHHRRAGTVHLLAVSGFHVGIVILCAGLAFGKRAVILSVMLWAYILLSGAAVSAVRAGLMIQAGIISRALGRPVSGVNAVSTAGVCMLMNEPLVFWDIGFRLSVLAAMAISTLPRKWYTVLMISPLISLVTFPQVSYTFGDIKLVGLILNVIAPMYFAFALSIASGFGVLRLMGVPLVKYIMPAVEGIFALWEAAADFCAMHVPYVVEWNYLLAWMGAGTLIFCVCRYFRFDVVRTFAVMIAGSFAAFVMFL